ncbi:transcriptional regulator GutM [Paucisalibacillus sp. EB02]|uniref:transcriptional regulator GutM n=1 Tax=Paucisalibacillus sp. EB02 TaxID=1347087 RepID=UPI0004BC9429|nr:transcriptional regulator GutM [Paucisalibacillus sp. EB02]
MELAVILTLLLVIQNVLSFIQIRYYRKNMNAIVSRYSGKEGYYLFSEREKRKLLRGAMVMMVVDNNYIIKECYFVNGVTTLSRFTEHKAFKGKHVGEMLRDIQDEKQNKKKISALSAALGKVAEAALINISKKNISVV